MTTLNQVMQAFIEKTGIGFLGTADAAPNNNASLTDATELTHVRGTNDFDGWWVWFAGASGDNVVKRATTVVKATGVLSVDTAYSSNTETAYRLLRPEWHPTRYLVPLANRALQKAWLWWREPLTLVENGNAEASSVGGSDSNATTTAVTTAANVWEGKQALNVANSGANGYHQYATFDGAAGRAFRIFAKARIAVGTARLQIIDITNSNTVLAQQTASGVGQWWEMQASGTFPSNSYRDAIRAGADEATGDVNWDDVSVYWEPLTRFALPSSVTQWRDDEGTDLLRVYRQVNRLGRDGAWPARAYDLQLINPSEYQISYNPAAANPLLIEMGRELTWDQVPLVIEYRRPYYDFGAVAAGTSTSSIPLDLWVYAMMTLAAEERNLNQPLWNQRYDEEQRRGTGKLLTNPPDNNGGAGGFAYQKM